MMNLVNKSQKALIFSKNLNIIEKKNSQKITTVYKYKSLNIFSKINKIKILTKIIIKTKSQGESKA